MLKLTIGLLGFLALVNCYSFSERKWKFLLPKETMKELFDLDANSTRDPVGVDKEIDRILRNQSRHFLNQLDLPPYYEQLPFIQRWQIKDVLFDKELSYEQKLEMIHDLIRKLPVEQQRFPTFDSNSALSHSRYFEAFSTLQYRVNFNFKLSELKRVLSDVDKNSILSALDNPNLDIDEKTAAIDRVMSHQPFEVIDQLFFTGVPIVDAEVRERFRRLFLERGFWISPTMSTSSKISGSSFAQTARIHPPCILKPSCSSSGPVNDASTSPIAMNPNEKSEIMAPTQPLAGSIVVEVQTNGAINENNTPIVSAISNQPTSITVNGRPIAVNTAENNSTFVSTGPIRASRIEVVVQSKRPTETNDQTLIEQVKKASDSLDPNVTMETKQSMVKALTIKADEHKKPLSQLPVKQNNFVPWNPPKTTKINESSPSIKSVSSSSDVSTSRPISSFVPTRPNRWSSDNGIQRPLKLYSKNDERDFLIRWYKSFGVALRDNVNSAPVPKPQVSIGAWPSTSRSTVQPLSPASEAHLAALQIAHKNREQNQSHSLVQQNDEPNKPFQATQSSAQEPGTDVAKAKKIDAEERQNKNGQLVNPIDLNVKHVEPLANEKSAAAIKSKPSVQAAILSPTIRPSTVVVNREAKEKLVVRHSQLGNTLHLEKLNSAELRETEKSNSYKSNSTLNDDANGAELLESLQNSNGTPIPTESNDKVISTSTVPAVSMKPVPSGLIKLRNVLRQLRDRIRANRVNSTEPTAIQAQQYL
ncbi:hypothetical protein M3Y96_00715100 [Aphelenchoides besseyi]|nr:hypothetical protein M3Y96_00715100 [Aphelenchoides besseyi]